MKLEMVKILVGLFVKHVYLPESLLAPRKEHDGVMAHYIVTTKHHLMNQPESCMHTLSQTLVNRSLSKTSKIHK